MAIIQGHAVNSASASNFYPKTINESLRFNDDDNAHLDRTMVSPTNNKIFTLSVWVKRANLGTDQMLFSAGTSTVSYLQFQTDDTLKIRGSGSLEVETVMKFRDVGSWYHIVFAYDSAQSKDTERARLYVNGTEITNFSPYTKPALNEASALNSAVKHSIGTYAYNDGSDFDGYLAEMYFVDGTALTPSAFAETKNNIWIPKKTSISSFGNNGFHLTFSDSSDIGADSSGEGHDFTPSGLETNDVVSDSPTNNFCTLNTLTLNAGSGSSGTLSNGNLNWIGTGGNDNVFGTMAVSSGQWYYELEILANPNTLVAGWSTTDELANYGESALIYYNSAGIRQGDRTVVWDTNVTTGLTLAVGEVIGFALDIDAGNLKVYQDGTLVSTITLPTDKGDEWIPAIGDGSSTDASVRTDFGQQSASKSGYLPLSTANLPDPGIDPNKDEEPRDYFETFLYTGNGAGLQVGDVIKKPADTTTISKSLIFNDADSAHLDRTFVSPTDNKTWTWSAWIKRSVLSTTQVLFGTGNVASGSTFGGMYFDTSDRLVFFEAQGAGTSKTTTRTFKNTSMWYHIVVNKDAANTTAAIYVNGIQETSLSPNTNPSNVGTSNFNSALEHTLGGNQTGSYYFDGYMAETHFVDGIAYDPTYFGNFDANGIWIPKAVTGLTYGDNGFYLDFADSSALGDDESGETHDWTSSGHAPTDQVVDSPTNNHMNIDSGYQRGSNTFSEGNLTVVVAAGSNNSIVSHRLPRTGKHYFEFELDTTQGSAITVGLVDATVASGSLTHYAGTGHFGYYATDGNMYVDASTESYGASYTAGDIIGVAIDFDAKTVQFYKNNTSTGGQGVFDYSRSQFSNVKDWRILASNATGTGGHTLIFDFGQRGFTLTPPTGYTALSENNITVDDQNLESPDFVWIKNRDTTDNHHLYDSVRGIKKALFSGTTTDETDKPNGLVDFNKNGFTVGSDVEVNTSGEDYVAWTWKSSGTAQSATYAVKVVSDSGNKYRFDDFGSSAVTLELSEGGTYTFDQSDSSNSGHPLRFSTTSDGTHNSGSEYTTGVTTNGTPGSAGASTVITVAANAPTLYYYCSSHSGMGGQANTPLTKGYSNFKGSIQSKVLASTESGFSILTYTGSGGASDTIGHGLSSAPEMVIVKDREQSNFWAVYHAGTHGSGSSPEDYLMRLNTTDDKLDNVVYFNDTAPTSTVFTIGTSSALNDTSDYLAYCFHSVEGYSKVGYYEGTNNADNVFVYTGFRPAWIMIKNADATGSWGIWDVKRNSHNTSSTVQYADQEVADNTTSTTNDIDILSNGFKVRGSAGFTGDVGTYIYLAFAEQPFKYANAR